MSAEISVAGEPFPSQRLRSPSEYATQVKHDWERKSFERFFEAGGQRDLGAESSSVPRRTPTEAAVSRYELKVSESAGQTAEPIDDRSFSGSSASVVIIESASEEEDRPLGSASGAANVSRYSPPSGRWDDQDGLIVGEHRPLWASSSAEAAVRGASARTAAAVPASSALVVKLTETTASIWLRDAQLESNDIAQLRYAIASELGWAGLSLASFTLNGQDVPTSEPRTPSAQAGDRAQATGKNLFRFIDGEAE